jgi:DNA-binding CsgD family transcriptional regulator
MSEKLTKEIITILLRQGKSNREICFHADIELPVLSNYLVMLMKEYKATTRDELVEKLRIW